MSTFFANFNLLKILDFEDGPVEYLSEGVGNLFHLHYLSLRRTKIKELPKSIGMLINLESLDLKHTFVSELPAEIKNLKKLRCLIVLHRDGFITKIHKGFGALTNLHKLQLVEGNFEVLEELKQLRLLRSLDIRLENRDWKDLFVIVENMENLESLAVTSKVEEEIVDVSSMASAPQSLQSLFLEGNIKKLPFWISELQKLIKIQLVFKGTTDIDPISVLQALPNLLRLMIRMTYCDEKLHFKDGWFPKLEELHLENFGELKWMMIDKGSMPNLKQFRIGPCPLLKELPTGIEHLIYLKTLVFRIMLKEIYWMMKGENWEKLTKHIPQVLVTYKHAYGFGFYYNTRYLSSLSCEDFEQLVEKQSHP
ncbi:disease resistance protein RPM1-like isoform X2 [Pistacia vera]|uniref:disease resistance protein RPM1-like isoform X2 n=1 Tax=Pistacia vera TaxID=55513 RepID=UPI001263C6C3|nr:disease resistance protein RPM1-like isoform X2 [Pistacia vera]